VLVQGFNTDCWDHLWLNIVFLPRAANPRDKYDRYVGLELGWSLELELGLAWIICG